LRTLVHAAGLSPSMAPGRRILEVNLVGTALVERAFLPLAIKRTVGIFIASQAGHVPPFGDSRDALLDNPLQPGFLDALASEAAQGADAYSISKRGVIRYCARRTMDWAARSARIMTISPGMIRTPMTEFEFPRQPLMKAMLDLTPMKRWGSAEDIAALVDYIASDEASFLTGTDILIDGGVTPLFAARGR
jgi:NAD(P)-dependent dehydrogenase (short-subunit alcohol dehydrogenase family)